MAKKIIGWSLSVTWDDDKEQNVYDVPDDVANVVDEWFNKIEEKGQGFEGEE